MGGRDKSRLPAPDTGEALAARLARLTSELGLPSVLVGGAPQPPLPHLLDDPPGIGPIGGLCALFAAAGQRRALALACDLPHATAGLIERLWREQPSAAVHAPRDPQTGKWEPLFARYDAARVLPEFRDAVEAGVRSMQTVLRELDVHELVLTDAERRLLLDWDRPGDLAP
jgi:molybdopterin-guanine dinucleotide biosynthesis protein A